MKGWVKGLLGLGIVAVVTAYLGSPLLSVRALVSAVEAGDEAALNRLVDFPVLRESAKDELTERLMTEMRDDPATDDGALAGLGMLFGPMLVDGAVDVLITPQAIVAMVETAEVPDPTDAATPSETAADQGEIRKSYAYRDLNTFVLGLTHTDRPGETLKLLLKRQGLFSWRLSGIELPEYSST